MVPSTSLQTSVLKKICFKNSKNSLKKSKNNLDKHLTFSKLKIFVKVIFL